MDCKAAAAGTAVRLQHKTEHICKFNNNHVDETASVDVSSYTNEQLQKPAACDEHHVML